MKPFKKTPLFSSLLSHLLLSATLLLSACGGDQSNSSVQPAVSFSPPPASAPADNIETVSVLRNSVAIKRSSNSFSLVDKGIVGGTTILASNKTSVKFRDFTVNLYIGDKSKTISAADLQNLTELYIAFFNRVPDADGMAYWIDKIKAGMNISELANNFYNAAILYSDLTGYSDTMSNTDFVRKIYLNVLGRNEVDADGLAYWTDALNKGAETRGTLIRSIVNAAHGFKANVQYGWVADLLDNKIAIGNYFSIQQGLNYNTDTESLTKGMAIAKLVTSSDTKAARDYIGVTDTIDLTVAAPVPQVTIKTSKGDIVVELNPTQAPITSANFLRYVDVGFYSNKIFHRVISNFMIQGGGFNAELVQASTYAPIKLEVNKGLSNVRGTIAMARTSVYDSATAQFFINVVDNVFLDTSGGGYAVFGKVISGMDVVDKIKEVPTTSRNGYTDVPVTTVMINSVSRSN
jgi:cyclophilin family peptidyl-prolyl cis-trans isomerase